MRALLNTAVGTFVALFPIANPIGGATIFATLTKDFDPVVRRQQTWRTTVFVLAILAVFLLAGRPLLELFGISVGVLRIAGGLIVAHTAWSMVTAQRTSPTLEEGQTDIAFTPMAMPLIAGPGAIGVVIGISTIGDDVPHLLGALAGIAGITVLTLVCLLLGDFLLGHLGPAGSRALTQILGFLILAVATQLVVDGIFSVVGKPSPGPFGS